MRFTKILKARRTAKKGQVSMKDLREFSRTKAELMDLLSSVLSNNDSVLIEIDDKAVPYFLDILDDPIFNIYEYRQVSQDKYIFVNKTLAF